MPFSDAARKAMYNRSKGECECTHQHEGADAPHQGGRCNVRFTFASGSGLTDWWDATFVRPEAEGGSEADNGEALCGACYTLVKAAVPA